MSGMGPSDYARSPHSGAEAHLGVSER